MCAHTISMKSFAFIACFAVLLSSCQNGNLKETAITFESFRLVIGKESSPALRNISGILERQITQRCDAKIETNKTSQSQLTIELSIESDIGKEGFRIEDGKAGSIRIIGGNERGVLYGVGKFLRTARYDQGGFTPGQWRGESSPKGTFRAVYMATHFMNYYEAAPIEEVRHYIEDIGLWGYNTI